MWMKVAEMMENDIKNKGGLYLVKYYLTLKVSNSEFKTRSNF